MKGHNWECIDHSAEQSIVTWEEESEEGTEKLRNAKLRNLYYLPNIRVIKSKKIKWVEKAVCVQAMGNV
jgi:hypothetical protein